MPSGTEVWVGPHSTQAKLFFMYLRENGIPVTMGMAHWNYFEGHSTPSYVKLKEWGRGHKCPTPTGEEVDPADKDKHGFSSWLLIFGRIN